MTPPPAGRAGPLRALLVEHVRADAELCLHELERAGFDVRADVVETPEEFDARLRAESYEIVLADYRLPMWTGMDALAALRAHGLDTPLILVTGSIGEERAVECLHQGAADYILKENLARLPVAVRRALDEHRARRERVQAEALIRKLTLAVDQSPGSVIITDTKGTIEYVNRRFVEVTGYTAEEAVGKSPRLLQSGRNPVETYRDMWRTILAGHVWKGEIQNRRKNGELYWDSVLIAPVRDPSGTVTHFLATQEDITERKNAEQVIRDREERFRQLAENIQEVFFIMDAQYRETLYINPAYETIWGRSCRSLHEDPQSFLAPVPPEDQPRLVEYIAAVQRGEDPGELEFRVVRPDGEVRWVLAHAVPIRNEQGEVYRISGVALDITERHRLAEQFHQAQKLDAVGRLAGGVAHDFNNLLTVITSYSDLVINTLPPGDPLREDVDEIQKAAASAATLTRQLLAFSRQQVIEPRVVSLPDIVAHTEKLLKRLIGEDIELVALLSPTPLTIRIDPGQLEQVIVNLAVNARDAMPTGGKLTIEATAVDLDESYARTHWPAMPGRFAMLAITDTGIGMDDQTRARIFEPFFTTKEMGKGTGLGLATVYGIVKQSGGFIWVYSEPGQGTTFKIYLPLVDEPAERLESRPAPKQTPRGTETVLLAEDAAAVRAVARQILERYGYTVLEAPSGKLALDVAGKHPQRIDLLVTDVVMPQMGGRDLAAQFTALQPRAKVLYMSGYTDDAVLRHGVLGPGIAFIQKPFSPDAFARKVREVLDAP